MLQKLSAFAFVTLSLALVVPGCHTKPPKQGGEASDALTETKGADISTGQDSSGNIADTGAKSGEEAMHAKCCGQCKEGLAKDRTGMKPDTIPCDDFTAQLDPICLEHFRAKKTMASECK